MLGEEVPSDEQRSTRHLFRQKQFGRDIFHCLVLRAATLEAALVRADLPTKDATTSLQQHFQHKFVNAARQLYTRVLLEGAPPSFTSWPSYLLLPTYRSGSLTYTGVPADGTDHGRRKKPQEVPLLLRSTSRRRSPSSRWQQLQITQQTPPSSPVRGQLC